MDFRASMTTTGILSSKVVILSGAALLSAAIAAATTLYCGQKHDDKSTGSQDSSRKGSHGTIRTSSSSSSSVPLSPFQEYLMEHQDTGSDHTLCCVHLQGTVPSKEDLQRTVRILQARHRTLRAELAFTTGGGGGKGSCYAIRESHKQQEDSSSAGNAVNVVVRADDEWQRVFEEEANVIHFPTPPSADAPSPLWKVFLIVGRKEQQEQQQQSKGKSYLLFIFNHVVFDGTARNRLLRSFVQILGSLDDDINTINEKEKEDAVVDLWCHDDIFRALKTMPWGRFCRETLTMVWNEIRLIGKDWYYPLEDAPGIVNRTMKAETKIVFRVLTRDETAAIVRRSKAEGTTVHGALSAAAHLALDKIARDKSGITDKDAYFGSYHMISLWRNLEESIPKDTVTGCFISGIDMRIRTTATANVVEAKKKEQKNPWDMAREIKVNLSKFKQCSVLQYMILLLFDEVFKWKLPSSYRTLDRVRSGFMISNNGVVPFESNKKGFQVNAVSTCTTRHSIPADLGMFNIQTNNGVMSITFAYYTNVWSKETAQSFLSYFHQYLVDMSN